MSRMGSDETLPIDEMLADLGFDTPAARAVARRAMEDGGLTRPGKTGIAAYKRDTVEALLLEALAPVCGEACAALAPGGRAPVVTSARRCEVCGGSNNKRAAVRALQTLRRNGVSRLLVVGGGPDQHAEVARLLAQPGIEVECVDGTTRSHSGQDAISRMNRAQVMVIWGATLLRHTLSQTYTADPPEHLRVIKMNRRGVEALCDEITRSYELNPA